jgi:hypothetical protein
LRITGPAAGVRSCASSDLQELALRTLVELIRRHVAEADGHSCIKEEVKEGEASRDAG